MSVCDKCGLPDDLCVCEEIVKESQRVKITTATRRWGKQMTIIEGFDDPNIDLRDLTKKLKAKCACGGTVKEGHIELQGAHVDKIKKILIDMGYSIHGDNS